jgi:hypothetical protein
VVVEYEGTVIDVERASEVKAFAFCIYILAEESAFACGRVTEEVEGYVVSLVDSSGEAN